MKKKIIGILLIVFGISYAYSGFVSDVEYASLIGIAFCIVLVFFGLRLLGVIKKKKSPKAKPAASRPAAAPVPVQTKPIVTTPPAQPVSTPADTEITPKAKIVYAPDKIGDCQFAYEYHKVNVRPMAGLDINSLELGRKVSFAKGESTPAVMLNEQQIGTMQPGRIADMVTDWLKRSEPIFAVLEMRMLDENLIQLFVVFYRNLMEVAERRGLNRVKLVSNANQDMQESIACQEVGDPCYVMFDSDKEKWEVNASSGAIGYLPAKFKDDTISEDAKVIIAEIEENDETGKYSVWVYVM